MQVDFKFFENKKVSKINFNANAENALENIEIHKFRKF